MAEAVKKKKLSKYQKANKRLTTKLGAFVRSNVTTQEITAAIKKGENKYLHAHHFESTNYDPKWLQMIEDCIPDLGEILKNPRKVTKIVTDIVPVELAKKTNDESVRHLASHTQYVKTVDEQGNVIPNKVLNIGADDDYMIYENKFIATLVKRLVIFIEKRYEFLIKYAPLKENDVFMHKTTANIDGSLVEIETKVKITKAAKERVEGESNAYIKRVEDVRRYILYYMSTDFMKMFKNEKDVRGQILQTNIIRKNPKYHKCYLLYRYITSYNQLGIDYKVKEEFLTFSNDEMNALNRLAAANFLAMNPEDPGSVAITRTKVYKPRILNTIDDETFVYGPILDKPILMIRADDEYFAKKKNQIPEIKSKPSKQEAEYQKEDAERKKKLLEEERKALALRKRKEKEAKEFERRQALLLEKQRREEEARKKAEEAARRKEELDRLERARRALKQSAIDDRKVEEEEERERKLRERAEMLAAEEAKRLEEAKKAEEEAIRLAEEAKQAEETQKTEENEASESENSSETPANNEENN